MIKPTFVKLLTLAIVALFFSCAPEGAKQDRKDKPEGVSETLLTAIPDSITHFLIASAAKDFREHQPPTAVDFRNVKIGYLSGVKEKQIFILCGEFLSKEEETWTDFSTIKTSVYEQYLGKTQYCQDATFVLTDEQYTASLKEQFFK